MSETRLKVADPMRVKRRQSCIIEPTTTELALKPHHSTVPSQSKSSNGNTKVIARFRPKTESEEVGFRQEMEAEKVSMCTYMSEDTIRIEDGKDPETIIFDRIFPPTVSQLAVFECVGRPVIEDVLEGYNGTVFAYGQTGSGKTFTMMGTDVFDSELRGIVPRAASLIFSKVRDSDTDVEFTFRCSMLEIYKETLRDLLGPDSADLRIKEDPRKGIYVQGLTEVFVTSEEEMLEVISIGEQMRTVGTTKCNKVSSRSHQLFCLEVKQHFPNDSEKRGILNLVDLAGSEKVNNSGVTGNNLQEAKKINLSLSALGNVIHALSSMSDHVPYRDSKLTRLLQESLGGNYKTTLVIALSPCYKHLDETMNTIKFGQRVKHIKNTVKMNIKHSAEKYQQIIEELNGEVEMLKKGMEIMRNRSGYGRSVTELCIEGECADAEFQNEGRQQEKHKEMAATIEETTRKLTAMESDRQDLLDRIADLEDQLKTANRKLLKEEAKSFEYFSRYHQATQLLHKDSNDYRLLKKQNESQGEEIKYLTTALQNMDARFSKALQEMQQGSTMLEFEDREEPQEQVFEEVDSSPEDLTVNEESSLPDRERFTVQPHFDKEKDAQRYSRHVRISLENNSFLNKEVYIHQLKNQLMQ